MLYDPLHEEGRQVQSFILLNMGLASMLMQQANR